MSIAPMNRRTFLRSAGVCIGLPLLDAMLPIGLGAQQQTEAMRRKRMVLIGRGLGSHAPYFFPENAGKDYTPSRYMRTMQDHRDSVTVFSGMSHRDYYLGHSSEPGLFTGAAPDRIRPGDMRNSISLDQEVASRMGDDTRYKSLALGGGDLSWNRRGVRVPSETRATVVFRNLFVNGTPQEIAREVERLRNDRSILDGVREQARTLSNSLGSADRARLDLLLTSIREAEQRLQQDEAWVNRPKPRVQPERPFTSDHLNEAGQVLINRERQWYDLVHLALQTDSTRVISLYLWSHGEQLHMDGVTLNHHDASHHGRDENKIRQLAIIEEAEMQLFNEFLTKLKNTNEAGTNLLEKTVIFNASNLGNASAHTNDNLPILLAGGGFRHGGHVAFDRRSNKPLSNLFVRMLQQMDIGMDRFGSSTGTLSEV
jgi:hypothetical protein